MKKWISIVLFLAMSSVAMAMEDTPENREQQVDRYLQSIQIRELMEGTAKAMATSVPEADLATFMDLMLKHLNYDVLTQAMRSAMIKTFTADEIAKMADMTSSPVGKSAMSKMSTLMSEFMKSDAMREAMRKRSGL